MQYAILVYESENNFNNRTDEQHKDAYWGAFSAYSQALAEAGAIAGGAALYQPHAGTTVRLRDGQRQVQDGPYAETKEQLGGFFLIDVPDLDAALDWAARCPAAADGAVEVRPFIPMTQG
ncbi:MAG: YciI family protein [Nostoc sp. DedSLP01]|nr:YciI family protein [Nostoc sp. DedSLP05]MDZ8103958.1 YciI family protein [Nostoc sp. DedSLP01]